MRTRIKPTARMELSEEQEKLAQQVYARIEAKTEGAVLEMVRGVVRKAPEEIFDPGGFELRDRLNALGIQVLEEATNAQAKKGLPGS